MVKDYIEPSEIKLIERIVTANKQISIKNISQISNIEHGRCYRIIKLHDKIFNIEKTSQNYNIISMKLQPLKLTKTNKLITFVGNAPREEKLTWIYIEQKTGIDMSLQKNRSMLYGVMHKYGVKWDAVNSGIMLHQPTEEFSRIKTSDSAYKWARGTISGHKTNKYTVNITTAELIDIAHSTPTCCYCGQELDWNLNTVTRFNTPSLDRIDNSAVIDNTNVEIICKRCNTTKGARTKSEFINYCKIIYDKFGGINEMET